MIYDKPMVVMFSAEKLLSLEVDEDGKVCLVYDHDLVGFVQSITGTIDVTGEKAKVRWSASFVYPSHDRVNEEVLSALKKAGFDVDVMVLTDN